MKEANNVCVVGLGTGFQSKGSYLFGHFSMHLKLVGGDSAGTVTAFYVSSISSKDCFFQHVFQSSSIGQPIANKSVSLFLEKQSFLFNLLLMPALMLMVVLLIKIVF